MSITTLPPEEHTFTISIKGQESGKVWDGTFTYTLPNLRAEAEIAKTAARLNEGLTLDEDIAILHEMLAYLTHTLTSTPEWWSTKAVNLEVRDYNIYTELFSECMKFKKEWKDKVWSEKDESDKSKKNNKAS